MPLPFFLYLARQPHGLACIKNSAARIRRSAQWKTYSLMRLPIEAVSIVTALVLVDHAFTGWGSACESHFVAAGRASRRNGCDVFHMHETAPYLMLPNPAPSTRRFGLAVLAVLVTKKGLGVEVETY